MDIGECFLEGLDVVQGVGESTSRRDGRHEMKRTSTVYTWMSKRVGKISGFKDIFQGYHTKGDVQSTYVGAVFHNNKNITYRSTRTMYERLGLSCMRKMDG